MRALSKWKIALAAATVSLGALGCSVVCVEDATGTKCTAKSLKRFDGAAQPPQLVDRAPGAPLTVNVLYGNVLVQRGASSGKVEVHFQPFVYAGHDEQAIANQQLTQNLRTSVQAAGGVTVTVGRDGGSNGLGADTIVRIPDDFDGPLTVINQGGGPLNQFELKVEFVGKSSALNITNQSLLGNCWVQGAPTVRSTTVQCGEDIAVFDVSDDVNITNTDDSHDVDAPAIVLRLNSVSPQARGGRVISTSGAVQATFPAAGGYVINAKSPVKGVVQEGGLPAGCTKQEASPSAKTITCRGGPAYEVVAGSAPDYVGQPKDSNVILSYQ